MSDVRGLIWLASYPKSGSTWARLFLRQFLIDLDRPVDLDTIDLGGSIASNRPSFDEVVGLPSSDLTDDEVDELRPYVYKAWAEQAAGPCIVKVHDSNHLLRSGRRLFPTAVTRRAVHLVRNPLDIAVSHAFQHGEADFDRSVATLVDNDRILAGNRRTQLRQRLLDWSAHTLSWHCETSFPVATFRYESLVADPVSEFGRLVSFLELDGADDRSRVERAVAHTRFDRLRSAEAEGGFRERNHRQERFFRVGRAGDWRHHLSPVQVKIIVGAHREVMQHFDYLDGRGEPC